MIGGVFLCFEGTEKVHQMIAPHATLENSAHVRSPTLDARTLEEETVTGAIRTDFILSAEIMAISLASIATSSIVMQTVVLVAVAVLVTAGVYGLVAAGGSPAISSLEISIEGCASSARLTSAAKPRGRLRARRKPTSLGLLP